MVGFVMDGHIYILYVHLWINSSLWRHLQLQLKIYEQVKLYLRAIITLRIRTRGNWLVLLLLLSLFVVNKTARFWGIHVGVIESDSYRTMLRNQPPASIVLWSYKLCILIGQQCSTALCCFDCTWLRVVTSRILPHCVLWLYYIAMLSNASNDHALQVW